MNVCVVEPTAPCQFQAEVRREPFRVHTHTGQSAYTHYGHGALPLPDVCMLHDVSVRFSLPLPPGRKRMGRVCESLANKPQQQQQQYLHS